MPTNAVVSPVARYKTLEYLELDAPEDAEPFRVKVRSNLTYGELEALSWEADEVERDTDLYERFAPYVVEWNIAGIDAKGKRVEIPPPAVGGPDQFQYIHPGLFTALVRDIRGLSYIPLGRKPKPATASGDAGTSGGGAT